MPPPHRFAFLPGPETLFEDAADVRHVGVAGYAADRGRTVALARALAAADAGRTLVATYTYTETARDPDYVARIVWSLPVLTLLDGAVVGADGITPARLAQPQGIALRYIASGPGLQVVTRFANAVTGDELSGRLRVTLS